MLEAVWAAIKGFGISIWAGIVDIGSGVWAYAKGFLVRYEHFISLDYYKELFDKYFSLAGFAAGFVFVLLVYFASRKDDDDLSDTYVSFVRVLAGIAVINSCGVIVDFLNEVFRQGHTTYNMIYEAIFDRPENVISGCLLLLIVFYTFKDADKGPLKAFLFGVAVYAVMPLMGLAYLTEIGGRMLIWVGVRMLLAGGLCAIVTCRKHFYAGWLWYLLYYVIGAVAEFFASQYVFFANGKILIGIGSFSMSDIPDILSNYILDFAVYGLVLLVALFFEAIIGKTKTFDALTAEGLR